MLKSSEASQICHCEEHSDQAIAQLIYMHNQYYVYIVTNKYNTVLYTGVTNNLKRRIHEHKEKLVDGFSKRYNINKLVYYEISGAIENAIIREKQIKGGSRQDKINLVNKYE